MGRLARWKQRAQALKAELHAVALACRDPRVPWRARALAVALVAYAASPVDLIPDFVPVLGLLDDLVLLPLGITIVVRMIPDDVLADCRERVRSGQGATRWGRSRLGAGLVVGTWIALLMASVWVAAQWLQ